MLESIFQLGYKAKAGLVEARQEIKDRINCRVELPLKGLNGEGVYLTAVDQLGKKAKTIHQLYDTLPHKNKAKDVILLDAWSSATIEGARTTVEQVSKCFEHPDSKDEKMVVNTVTASHYAYKNPISPKNIRKLWEIVVKDVCENENQAGEFYRSGMVYIGSNTKTVHTPASVEQIAPLMTELFQFEQNTELDALIASFVFHFCFVYIHPFCDGNGRTARIINSSQLYWNGMKKMKYLPLSTSINEHLNGYYRALSESERQYDESPQGKWIDISPFVSYMLDMFEQCLINSALAENSLSDTEAKLLERMKKVGVKAEITVANAAKILSLSDSGARKVLNRLAAKGYLKIEKGSKRYIYRLEPDIPY